MELITYEEPETYTKKNVVYWSEHYKSLNIPEGKARQFKAKKFIENDCIEWDKELKCFICKPIIGYNKTTYHLVKIGEYFECSCQFYCKTKKMCSHLLALYLYFKLRKGM